jgi:hypothetical protein
MPLGPGVRYRVKQVGGGKQVRLAFKGDKVVEATPLPKKKPTKLRSAKR